MSPSRLPGPSHVAYLFAIMLTVMSYVSFHNAWTGIKDGYIQGGRGYSDFRGEEAVVKGREMLGWGVLFLAGAVGCVLLGRKLAEDE